MPLDTRGPNIRSALRHKSRATVDTCLLAAGSFPKITMANAQEVEFLNFLKKYDLEKYHERLLQDGVKRIDHLQHVKIEDLEKIGMSRPESQRLLGKYEKHFSKFGKFKVS